MSVVNRRRWMDGSFKHRKCLHLSPFLYNYRSLPFGGRYANEGVNMPSLSHFHQSYGRVSLAIIQKMPTVAIASGQCDRPARVKTGRPRRWSSISPGRAARSTSVSVIDLFRSMSPTAKGALRATPVCSLTENDKRTYGERDGRI